MQIQRKSNGSAALRIAGRLIFSFPCLLAADGIAALVVSLLFCHASSLDLVNSFPRLLPVCFACKIEERSRTDGGKKEPLCHANYDIAEDRPCDTLELTLCKGDGSEENWSYPLNAAEQDVLLRKMDAFCQQQTGMSLREYAQQLHEEQAQTSEMQM